MATSTFNESLVPTSMNYTIPEQIILLRRFMYAVGYLELVICIIGTPINALVFYLAVNLARRGGAATGGKQQWFVASMTAADFLFTSVHSPMFFALYSLACSFKPAACTIFYFASHVAIVASSLSLLLINVDKFVALHKPLHYKVLMTRRKVTIILIGCWLLSIFWALFLVFGPFLTNSANCSPRFKPGYQVTYYVFTIIFFGLPLLASVFIAVFVIAIARRSTMSTFVLKAGTGMRMAGKWFLEMELANNDSVGSPSTGGGEQKKKKASKQSSIHSEGRKKNVKAITFVVTTTLWSAVTLLPYRFAFIMNLTGYTGVLWPSILLTMTAMNALGNPFITIAAQRQYRKGLRRLWNRLLCRHSLSMDDALTQQVAATIRMLCQQQEQLITAASKRAAKYNASIPSSSAQQSLLTASRTLSENTYRESCSYDTLTRASSIRD